MKKGKIILIEGTDCSGKETQSKLLVEKLLKDRIKTIYLTFPNYNSPTGKIVGGPYLGKPEICDSYFKEGPTSVPPKVASLYYAADRLYNIDILNKFIDDGYIIILDRYIISNMAHQGGKIINEDERYQMYDFLEKLEYDLLKLPKPDTTILLHMPYKYACLLKKNRINLDGHEKSMNHLKHAEKAYLELKDRYNFKYINCIKDNSIRTIEDINEEIYDYVKEIIKVTSK